MIVLIVIAENPRMPFFFRIPAWVIGLIIILIPFLSVPREARLARACSTSC